MSVLGLWKHKPK